MSPLTIFIKGFSGLGIASTIPLSLAFHNDTIILKTWTRTSSPEKVTKQVEPSNQPVEQMFKMLQDELGKDKKADIACFTVSGGTRTLQKPSLYICADLSETNPTTFWFHYNWNLRSNSSQRVNQITGITYQNSRLLKMQFKGGTFGEIKVLANIPEWLSKWKDKNFDTKNTCSFTKDQSTSSYTLTCPAQGQKTFTQKVKDHEFHRPTALKIDT